MDNVNRCHAEDRRFNFFFGWLRASQHYGCKKCVPTRHVARNFDGGEAKKSQVLTFDYLMPLVFEAPVMKCAFFWRLFLNDTFSQFFHFSSLI